MSEVNGTANLRTDQRVNYVHGLVLGVDEFQQEETYLLAKDRLHNRSLHGYGTVCGLQVQIVDQPDGPEIQVSPGIAVARNGQVIEVRREQCGRINNWLSRNADMILAALGSPSSGSLAVRVMLCYRDRETEIVPIPTGPCKSFEESTAASRLEDDFAIQLELINAPGMGSPAADTSSGFSRLLEILAEIPVDASSPGMTVDEIRELLRAELGDSSPAIIPSPGVTHIHPDDLNEIYDAALLLWVTELSPCDVDSQTAERPDTDDGYCVQLADLSFDVVDNAGIVRVDSPVAVDERARPYLLATHYLQTLLTGPETPQAFASPIILSGAARVTKRISLPVALGRQAGTTPPQPRLFNSTLPSMRWPGTGGSAFSGEVLFSIPIPDDIDYSEPMQFRAIWGYEGPDSDIALTWRFGAEVLGDGDTPPASRPFTSVTSSVPASNSQQTVLTSPLTTHPSTDALTPAHRYIVFSVGTEDPGGAFNVDQVDLLSVEVEYTADRLGA